jgi:biopolymer transport protein ExbD
MGMSVGSDSGDEDTVLSEINTTPLVDVMLVLLIIFLITIPVVTTSIKVDLPKEKLQIRETKPENVIISVDTAGRVFYYDTQMKNQRDLIDRLKKVAVLDPQPEVHIRGDFNATYEGVGKTIFAVQRAGITKVAFLTEPPSN